jgi:hypothetical protein
MAQLRVPKFIHGFGKSYAMLCHATADTAIIFVHGFNGKPTSTWRDFHGLVDEYSSDHEWWGTSDMFFYSYESLHTPIRKNAQKLTEFVEGVWRGVKSREINTSRGNYKDLILVGHSEGGVVIRRMILDRFEAHSEAIRQTEPVDRHAYRDAMKVVLESDFLMRAYLRLFAPACMGTNFSSWAGFLTSLPLLVGSIAASSLVRNELLPTSTVLNNLKLGTEEAHSEFPKIRSLFTSPLFGVPDHIVTSDSYRGEELLLEEGWSHTSICKPTHKYKRPLEFVSK